MSAPTDTRPTTAPAAGAPPRAPRGRAGFVLAAAALAALTVALRLYHQGSAYELFIDEVLYTEVGSSFAAGTGPELFGAPFFLHPPLFFALLGVVVGDPASALTAELVLSLRWVVLVPAAVNCLLVVAVARRMVGRAPALLAGLLYALDPFVIRFDSRLMLEAPLMCAVLAGLLAALLAAGRVGRARRVLLVLAGIGFGLALVTKSTSALVTAVPLLVVVATAWGLRRLEAVLVLAVQAAVYAGYLGWVLATGRIGPWAEQTLGGVARAVGTHTETGFNAPHTPSFTERALANLDLLGPSYALIAAGALAVAALGLRAWRTGGAVPDVERLMGVWWAGVGVAIGYTFLFAEIEEQTFYQLAVPALLAVAVAAGRLRPGRPGVRVAAAGLLVLVLAGAAVTWTRVHGSADDAYARMLAHVEATVPAGTGVALGDTTAQFVLPGYVLEPLVALEDVAPSTRYALVSTELSEQGLVPASAEVVAELEERHALVHVEAGRTVGELRLYDLTRPAGDR